LGFFEGIDWLLPVILQLPFLKNQRSSNHNSLRTPSKLKVPAC
jgi:hypothetical protein